MKIGLTGVLACALLLLTSCTEKPEKPEKPESPETNPEAPAETPAEPAKEAGVQTSPGKVESVALNSAGTKSADTPMFTIVKPEESGVEFANVMPHDERLSAAFSENIAKRAAGNTGTGVSTGDYDGDGLIDIYFVAQSESNKLYRQVAPWKFEDVTESAGGLQGGEGSGTGPAFADIDNDGDLDLYVCEQDAPDLLFVNQGDGTFVEDGAARGLGDKGPSIMAAFCDYDRDGDLDMYLVRNKEPGEGIKPHPEMEQREQALLESGISLEESGGLKVGLPDILYRNDGEGKFTDVSKEAGIGLVAGMGLSATWWDSNNDNWPDLYVANDFGVPDMYFHNMGDGTFKELAADAFPFLPWFSMGSDAADLNNDGMFDLIGTDMAGTTHFEQKIRMGDMRNSFHFLTYTYPEQMMTNTVYLNAGIGRFLEVGRITGMSATDWTWAVRIADYDNDGLQDAFFTNGFYANARDSDRQLARILMDEWQQEQGQIRPGEPMTRFVDYLKEQGFVDEIFDIKSRPPLAQKNVMFHNEGDLKFKKVSDEWGFGEEVVSFGAAVSDLDGDGDLDILANGLDGSVRMYRNEGDQGNRVTFRFNGVSSNRFGIGARVTIETASGKQVQLLRASRGYQGGDHPEVHFGLGSDEKIDMAVIDWPSGIRQELTDLAAGHRHTVTEPVLAKVDIAPAVGPHFGPPAGAKTYFAEAASAEPKPAQHFEQYHHDFADQFLIPFQMSQMGPGIAVADLEGDGKEEIWLGGALGQLGQIIERDHDAVPRIANKWGADMRAEALPEDMGGVFFDADGDNDLDLYVVSGSVELGKNAEGLRDRLYLNDGKGYFSRAVDALPDIRESGSVVVAGDVDRDGDMDLFVGSRSVPQEYPASAPSHLLINEGGKFVDGTQDVFVGSDNLLDGLVTSALWTDVDGNGWLDLLVVEEWGPVRVFKNTEGKLEDVTIEAGLGEHLGWWNGISAGDIDNDGDIDLAVSNFGLNTKYQIKGGKPRKIYFADFDGNGKMDIVEAKYDGDSLMPVRGRSCSTLAMPALASKFTTYRKFALATLEEIYTEQSLKEALSRSANVLSHSVMINDGNGVFEVKELPRFAQIAPSFGLSLQDFNGDGNLDLIMTQNFYPNQIETGPNNNGVGLLLMGDGTGEFEPVWPAESGFYVPEDARSLAIADLNKDNWPDVIVGVNNGPMKYFLNQEATRTGNILKVNLEGPQGNPTAIGARVTITTNGGRKQAREIYAGGSYLSQSSPALFFGVAEGDPIRAIDVRWPDGSESKFVEGFEGESVTLKFRN